MKISLKRSTGGYTSIPEFLKFAQTCARQCYSDKDFDELEQEEYNPKLINMTLENGHHSVYEHLHLTFDFKKMPKALAMIFNNEKQYVTSEKSARYTQMKEIVTTQKEKYDKWMEIFQPKINEVYPQMKDEEIRKGNLKKLAQENARYMTSVFTPTNMTHTINLRQLNFLIHEFNKFIDINLESKNHYNELLSGQMVEFVDQVKDFTIEDLRNQTDRHLSFFGKPVEEHFGDVYSTNYQISFAGLAQAHRHRTINYQISDEIKLNAPLGFHIPKIIRGDSKLEYEWVNDLKKIAEEDFPQAQLVPITERGLKEDFRSKLILRLCGHAQHEIMERTLDLAKKYTEQGIDKEWLKPKCVQRRICKGNCIWGGRLALERLV